MFELLFTLLNVNKKDEKYNIDKRVDDIIKRCDSNGNKKLSREEFVNGVKQDATLRKLLLGIYVFLKSKILFYYSILFNILDHELA